MNNSTKSFLRVCGPCVVAALLANTAMSADALIGKFRSELNLMPGTDVTFAKTRGGDLTIVVNSLDDLKRVHDFVEKSSTSAIDADNKDLRFFHQTDDDRYVADVSYPMMKQILGTKKVNDAKWWNRFVDQLVAKAGADTQAVIDQ